MRGTETLTKWRQPSPMNKSEIIVEIGAEGGSMALCRKQTERGWAFTMEVNDWTAELLGDEPMHKMSGPVDSWEAAVELLDRYPWPKLFPVFVHPDFKRQLWDAMQERLPNYSETSQSAEQNWRRICGQD